MSNMKITLLQVLATGLCMTGVASSNQSLVVRSDQATCNALGTPCAEDCDCCGYEDKSVEIRCEKRNKSLGYRCYKGLQWGQNCEADADCRSQKCSGGVCVPFFTHGPKVPTCPLSEEYVSAESIKGTIQETDMCGCIAEDPSDSDAANALDGDPNTVYVNHYATGGGIAFEPKKEGGLTSIKICNSDDCPECDPACYKLEGFCDFKNEYETLQEGTLDFPEERNSCVDLHVNGKPNFKKYKLTFPCQKDTCRLSCAGECHAKPTQHPEPGPCPDYVYNYDTAIGTMFFLNRNYDAVYDRTSYYYEVIDINISYLRLAWEGDCMIDYYYVFKDVEEGADLNDMDACCFRKCGNDFVKDESKMDPFLCMQGLMITSGNFEPGAKYIIKIVVKGDMGTAMLPYGMVGMDPITYMPTTEFGKVLSPVCPEVLCEGTCPLKLSDVTFFTQDCA